MHTFAQSISGCACAIGGKKFEMHPAQMFEGSGFQLLFEHPTCASVKVSRSINVFTCLHRLDKMISYQFIKEYTLATQEPAGGHGC